MVRINQRPLVIGAYVCASIYNVENFAIAYSHDCATYSYPIIIIFDRVAGPFLRSRFRYLLLLASRADAPCARTSNRGNERRVHRRSRETLHPWFFDQRSLHKASRPNAPSLLPRNSRIVTAHWNLLYVRQVQNGTAPVISPHRHRHSSSLSFSFSPIYRRIFTLCFEACQFCT